MEQIDDMTRLNSIADILICPTCSEDLNIAENEISCTSCNAKYHIQDGVPLLALMGTPDSGDNVPTAGEKTSDSYQQQYQDVDDASLYNSEYKDELFKRMSTMREFGILRRLLASQGHSKRVLDLPCGGGRLSPQIEDSTDLLIEADIGRGQVMYGKKNCPVTTPQIWMTASAFHLPFRDDSVDGTVCCRLCHHLPTEEERQQLMKEILRVSRKFVIMTFFDYRSLKNLLRRVRRPFDGQPPKMTMRIEEVAELAQANGARLLQAPYLAPLSSGHRYALLVKE